MMIEAKTREKPYTEVNGDEITLGDIGHMQVHIWSDVGGKEHGYPETPYQKQLMARIAELLNSDERAQQLLQAIASLPRR